MLVHSRSKHVSNISQTFHKAWFQSCMKLKVHYRVIFPSKLLLFVIFPFHLWQIKKKYPKWNWYKVYYFYALGQISALLPISIDLIALLLIVMPSTSVKWWMYHSLRIDSHLKGHSVMAKDQETNIGTSEWNHNLARKQVSFSTVAHNI